MAPLTNPAHDLRFADAFNYVARNGDGKPIPPTAPNQFGTTFRADSPDKRSSSGAGRTHISISN